MAKSSTPRRSAGLGRGVFRSTPERFFRRTLEWARNPARLSGIYSNSDPLDDGPQDQNVNAANTTFSDVTWPGEAKYSTPGIGRAAFVAYANSQGANGFETMRWDLPTTTTTTYVRGYYMFGAGAPTGSNAVFMQLRLSAGTTVQAQVRWNTSNQLQIRDATTAEGSSIDVVPYTVYRLEWTCIENGLFQLKGFAGDQLNNPADGTSTFTITSPSGLAPGRLWDQVQLGGTGNLANGAIWFADVAYSTSVMPAPLTYAVNSVAWAA